MAQRIVCLLPSATEICFALGLGDRVVGVSHECDFPAEAKARPALTAPKIDPAAPSDEIDRQVRALVERGESVYRVDEAKLAELAPDLIVTQEACEVCAVSLAEVEEVARRRCPGAEVVSLAPLTFADVLDDIRRVGAAAGEAERAAELVRSLQTRLDALRTRTAKLHRPRTLALEWLAPPMVAGHWTPELLRAAGCDPILAHDGAPTGPTPWQAIVDAAPEAILIFPCGFDVERSRAELPALEALPHWRELPAVRANRVHLLDGNAWFNRPGPRLVDGACAAAAAIHGWR